MKGPEDTEHHRCDLFYRGRFVAGGHFTKLGKSTMTELGNAYVGLGRHIIAEVNDKCVSRIHAIVFYRSTGYGESGSWLIMDLVSTNGTKVNSQPIGQRPVALKDGDTITLSQDTHLSVTITTVTNFRVKTGAMELANPVDAIESPEIRQAIARIEGAPLALPSPGQY